MQRSEEKKRRANRRVDSKREQRTGRRGEEMGHRGKADLFGNVNAGER